MTVDTTGTRDGWHITLVLLHELGFPLVDQKMRMLLGPKPSSEQRPTDSILRVPPALSTPDTRLLFVRTVAGLLAVALLPPAADAQVFDTLATASDSVDSGVETAVIATERDARTALSPSNRQPGSSVSLIKQHLPKSRLPALS